MNRFSVFMPSGVLNLSAEDRGRLASANTPGDRTRFTQYGSPSPTSSQWTDVPLEEFEKSTGRRVTRTVRRPRTVVAPPPEDEGFKPDLRLYLAFSALASLTLVIALEGTSISVALPTIAEELGGTAIESFWAGTSFLLTLTIFQPVYASFSNFFGRKQTVLVAVVIFCAGTIICGTAPDMTVMLAGRSLQGAGCSGIIALTNVLITDLVPLRFRGSWMGLLGAMWAFGSVIGPVVGGALAHEDRWPWIFHLNLPFIVVAFILVAMFIRLKGPAMSLGMKMRKVDWIGSAIFIASMTAFTLPLTWGGIMYDWDTYQVFMPLGFGVCGLGVLLMYERFVAGEPVIRLEVFGNRTTNIAYLTTAAHGMVLWTLLYYQPLYFEGVRGYKPIMAGVAMFPATFTVAPMAIIVGLIASKSGKYLWAVWFGWVATTMGLAFLCAIDIETPLIQVLHTDLIAGIGLGSLFPALQFQLQAASEPKNQAHAVAMFAFFRGLGQTLGIAIGGNIFQNELATKLQDQGLSSSEADDLAENAAALVPWMRKADASDERYAMRTAYTDALRTVYIVMAGVSLLATISTFWVKQYSLDQKQGRVEEVGAAREDEMDAKDGDPEAQREAEEDSRLDWAEEQDRRQTEREAEEERRMDWAEEEDRRRLTTHAMNPRAENRRSSNYSDYEGPEYEAGAMRDEDDGSYEQSRMEMAYRDGKPQSMARLERQTVTWI